MSVREENPSVADSDSRGNPKDYQNTQDNAGLFTPTCIGTLSAPLRGTRRDHAQGSLCGEMKPRAHVKHALSLSPTPALVTSLVAGTEFLTEAVLESGEASVGMCLINMPAGVQVASTHTETGRRGSSLQSLGRRTTDGGPRGGVTRPGGAMDQ